MEATTISTILTNVGDVVEAGLGWMGDVFSSITTEPLLMIFCVGLPLVGLGVGLAKRMLSVN